MLVAAVGQDPLLEGSVAPGEEDLAPWREVAEVSCDGGCRVEVPAGSAAREEDPGRGEDAARDQPSVESSGIATSTGSTLSVIPIWTVRERALGREGRAELLLGRWAAREVMGALLLA